MKSDLDDLIQVTSTLKEKAMALHRKNLEDRRRIENEIEQIDVLRNTVQADDGGLMARRAVGADSLWQSWLIRRRAELLREAAMARALEGESLTRAQFAFSRVKAIEELQKEEIQNRRQKKLAYYAQQLEELSVSQKK
ncbi:hypothetical protein [uncultured Pelagimonas sp.]|uniref:hypothetical protein n=1 Tax=uncultured Pelagimonas sp. TaxID=1618102 RepID=UPI00263401C9|nr:hypothetical protein [uncultured Pelagimonas sp.]